MNDKIVLSAKEFPIIEDGIGELCPLVFTKETADHYHVKFLQRVRTPYGNATIIGENSGKLWFWMDHLHSLSTCEVDGDIFNHFNFARTTLPEEEIYPANLKNKIIELFNLPPEEIVKTDFYFGRTLLISDIINKISQADISLINDPDLDEVLLLLFKKAHIDFNNALSKLIDLYLEGNQDQVANSSTLLQFILNVILNLAQTSCIPFFALSTMEMLGRFICDQAYNLFTDETDKHAYPLLFLMFAEVQDEHPDKQRCYLRLLPNEKYYPSQFNLAEYCQKKPAEFIAMFKTLLHEDNPFCIILKSAMKNNIKVAQLEYAKLNCLAHQAQLNLSNNNNVSENIEMSEMKEILLSLLNSHEMTGFFANKILQANFGNDFDYLVNRCKNLLAIESEIAIKNSRDPLQKANALFTNADRPNGVYTKSELDFAYCLYRHSVLSKSHGDMEKALTILCRAVSNFDLYAIKHMTTLTHFNEDNVKHLLMLLIKKIGWAKTDLAAYWLKHDEYYNIPAKPFATSLNNNNVNTDFFKIKMQMSEKLDNNFIENKHLVYNIVISRIKDLLTNGKELIKADLLKDLIGKIDNVTNLATLSEFVSKLAESDDVLEAKLPKNLLPDMSTFYSY